MGGEPAPSAVPADGATPVSDHERHVARAEERAQIGRLAQAVRTTFDAAHIDLDVARCAAFRGRTARAGHIDGAYRAALARAAQQCAGPAGGGTEGGR